MKNVAFNSKSEAFINQLQKGAFLTVKNQDSLNTMTIAWGNIGYMWNKPVMTVMVRYSRHTYNMIDESNEFSVSVPILKDMKKELGYCGTKSGRDYDKFKECEFNILENPVGEAPFIEGCGLHYACKVVYKQAMEPGLLNEKIKEEKYTNNDFHVLYYAEILGTYVEE